MPKNGHDRSSREIFSSSYGSFSFPPVTSGVIDRAAVARNAGPLISSEPSSFPESADQGFPPALNGAVAAVPRPATAGVGQDKGALDSAPQGTEQPAPETNRARSSRPQISHTKEKLQRASIWMRPGVKLSMRQIAQHDGLSFSATCATALEIYARQKIHQQEEALFEPRFRTIAREENRSLGNRLIFFEMRNAIAAEQTRILTADLYKRQLEKEGLSKAQIEAKLDTTYRLARANVLKKTPQLKALLDEWWDATEREKSPHGKGGTGKT